MYTMTFRPTCSVHLRHKNQNDNPHSYIHIPDNLLCAAYLCSVQYFRKHYLSCFKAASCQVHLASVEGLAEKFYNPEIVNNFRPSLPTGQPS